MPRFPTVFVWTWPLLLLCAGSAARADEAAILTDIKTFFAAGDEARREEIARRIEADPAYDRAQVRGWLHRSELFEPLKPGRIQIRAAIDGDRTLPVTLRVPSGYDRRRPYPLLYVLHGTRGDGDRIIGYVEQLLAGQIEQVRLQPFAMWLSGSGGRVPVVR